jgi:hypothetical protein
MYTVYGREMPGHCAIYLSEAPATRRLTCLQLREAADVRQADRVVVRFDPAGADPAGARRPSQRLNCTCAPVFDYTGREVARVGLFAHGPAEGTFLTAGGSQAWELARAISVRLGHLPTTLLPVTAPLTVTA